jgi:predicted DsbA family dithiol-disulfide isomerase
VEPDYVNSLSWTGLRTLALARRQGDNDAVERLYLALGNAEHGHKESIEQREVVVTATKEAALAPGTVDTALADQSTIQDVLNDHEEAVKRYHAFCVPTIAFEGQILASMARLSMPCHGVNRLESCGITYPGCFASPTCLG